MKTSLIEKLDKLMPHFPEDPPKDAADILRKRGYLKKEALIYRVGYVNNPLTGKKEKMVKVVCTACGESAYLEHVPADGGCRYSRATFGFVDPADNSAKCSGNTCICPSCGCGLKAMHIGDFKSHYTLDNKMFVTVHNIEGNLAVLSWIVRKNARSDGEVFYSFFWLRGRLCC